MDYGLIDDLKGHLDILKSEDIMFVYEGINQLKNHLAISNADSLGEFPLNAYCSRLIEILAAPMVMDIQGDLKCK